MNTNPLFRQEYIRLLWVHSQRVSTYSAKISEQRKALKLYQKAKLHAIKGGLGLVAKAYLMMRHLSEIREFNRIAEQNHFKMVCEQQEELRKLRTHWERSFQLNEAS
jgi:hypothetical protein